MEKNNTEKGVFWREIAWVTYKAGKTMTDNSHVGNTVTGSFWAGLLSIWKYREKIFFAAVNKFMRTGRKIQ